ncbi:MAG TPA: SDR family NAD(P)-dependent oxidoreductase [Rhizomicrobium sp.]|jgi:WW domain-containing oxidoreductase|nr:SDR family NAD(P)-dependent oxidoreductase [Rhizomicrobium sp.]
MNKSDFGRRSTADQVLAGIDLTGKRLLLTGCNSGLGLETLNAFAANGATVIGLARTLQAATEACLAASPRCIPVACDLANFDSIAAAAAAVRALGFPLDAIVANAGIANLAALETRYGVEMHFLINHIGHFKLVNGLVDLVRDGTGRIVIVSSAASIGAVPEEGIMFDNLDGRRFYEPEAFYAQSKLANAIYAKDLARRLERRGIAVNSADPGAARTKLNPRFATRLFAKTAAQAAATQALLAASPRAIGISGRYWRNSKVSEGNALLEDAALAARLWKVSEQILDLPQNLRDASLQQAA